MIEGAVRDRAARFELSVRAPGGRASEAVTVIIDTGFDGGLTLPLEIIGKLKLDWLGLDPWTLADGRSHDFDVYGVEVLWQGQWKPIGALETGAVGFLGMTLLDGFRITVDVIEGGGRAVVAPLDTDSEDE